MFFRKSRKIEELEIENMRLKRELCLRLPPKSITRDVVTLGASAFYDEMFQDPEFVKLDLMASLSGKLVEYTQFEITKDQAYPFSNKMTATIEVVRRCEE